MVERDLDARDDVVVRPHSVHDLPRETVNVKLRVGRDSGSPSRLELSDTKVYEPSIRARIETAAHFCEVLVLSPGQ